MEASKVSFIVLVVFSLVFAMAQAQSAAPAPAPAPTNDELGSRCANGLLLDPTPAVDSGMGKELALHSRIIAMYLSLWHLSALIIGCQQLISILVHHIHFLKYTHKNPQIYKTGTKKNINNNKMKDFCMSDQ